MLGPDAGPTLYAGNTLSTLELSCPFAAVAPRAAGGAPRRGRADLLHDDATPPTVPAPPSARSAPQDARRYSPISSQDATTSGSIASISSVFDARGARPDASRSA